MVWCELGAEYLAFCFMFKNSVILPSKQQTGKVSQQSSPCASTHESPVSGLWVKSSYDVVSWQPNKQHTWPFGPRRTIASWTSRFLRHLFVCVWKVTVRGSMKDGVTSCCRPDAGPYFQPHLGKCPPFVWSCPVFMLGCERTFFPHWALVLYFLFHSSAIFLSHFFPDLIP